MTDGGMETTLVSATVCASGFRRLPAGRRQGRGGGAAVVLRAVPRIAKRHGVGIVLDTPTWRANPDWGDRLGYSA